jgi:hypothetical protein
MTSMAQYVMGDAWNPKATPEANFYAGYRHGGERVKNRPPHDRIGFMYATFNESPRFGPYMRGQACGSAVENLRLWINDGCDSRDDAGRDSKYVLRNMGKYETSHIARRLIDEAEMAPKHKVVLRLVPKKE